MSDFISTTNGLIALATGLAGLIGTVVGLVMSIKAFLKANKDKTLQEGGNLIMTMADAAMKEAESSTAKGADKKQMVVESVKAACTSVGLNINLYVDQLSGYIDQSIKFYNDMEKAKTE